MKWIEITFPPIPTEDHLFDERIQEESMRGLDLEEWIALGFEARMARRRRVCEQRQRGVQQEWP